MEAIEQKIGKKLCRGFVRDKNGKEWLAIDTPCREDLASSILRRGFKRMMSSATGTWTALSI